MNDKIVENSPPNIHKTIWITYYIELLKARKKDKYVNVIKTYGTCKMIFIFPEFSKLN